MPLLLDVDVTGRLVLVVGCGHRDVPLDDALGALVRGDVEGARRLVNGPAPSAER
jgi:hypothetical protein